MGSSWTQTDATDYENDTGFSITFINDVPCLVSNNLDEEGIDFILPIIDIFNNPIMQAIFKDSTGKIPVEDLPNVIFGNTFYTDYISNLVKPQNYTDSKNVPIDWTKEILKKGDLVIVLKETVGGMTYRLVGDDPTNPISWSQLLSQYTTWNDIQGKPNTFLPSPHTHDDRYPALYTDINGNLKLPAKYLSSINLGTYIKVQNESDLPEYEDSGTFAIVVGENKLFISISDGVSKPEWIQLFLPTSGVFFVNGQNGIVTLTYSDVGAAAVNHTHQILEIYSSNNDDSETPVPYKISFNIETDPDTGDQSLKLFINNTFTGFLAYTEDLEKINTTLTNAINAQKTRIDNHENPNTENGFQNQLNALNSALSTVDQSLQTINTSITDMDNNKADKTELENLNEILDDTGNKLQFAWDGTHLYFYCNGEGPLPFA